MTQLRMTLALCAVAALSFLAFAGPASAASPCWKILVNDWYDGRIDGAYPVSCYRAAINNAPEDIKSYSSLTDDLRRAMQAAKVAKKGTPPVVPAGQKGRHGTGTHAGPAPGGPDSGGSGAQGTGQGTGTGQSTSSPFQTAIDAVGPKNATSVPVPLIVLAAVALLLLAAGSAGFVVRRVRGQRSVVVGALGAGALGLPRGDDGRSEDAPDERD